MSRADSDPRLADASRPEDELVSRFWSRLRLFATRWLGDATAGEDVAQETLRRVTDALRAGRVEHAAALPAFVFQTARHICLQWRRSASREARALGRVESGDRSDVNPKAALDALAALIAAERRLTVHQALEALDHDDRKLLRLAYFDQLTAEEIATKLGSTAGAVRVRKHRALRRLADHLQVRPRGVRGQTVPWTPPHTCWSYVPCGIACLVPARRATRVDPLTCIRAE